MEIYVPSDSEEEFDPKDLADIAKPPTSNFIWPPPGEEAPFPNTAPLYVAPPETQRITTKPCTYRPLEKPSQRLSVQNLHKAESQQTNSSEYECLNVDSNITATTSTSNASSESDYKMYQTQNNHYANMFEQTLEVDDEVEEINQKPIIDLRKTPPPIELPKTIKRVEFVEPEPSYKAETFKGVFSTRKETWQKLTASSFVSQQEERREEAVEVNFDENLNNSEEVQKDEDVQCEDDEEENDVEAEIKGQHVGPYDGSYYQLPPSNIPQPTPKGYQSDFQKALITTCERPYNIHDVAPTPELKLPLRDYYEEAVFEAQNYPIEEEKPKVQKEVPKFEVKTTTRHHDFPYQEQDVRKGSLMSSMMRTASPKPMEFVKSNIIDEVHLPDEHDAYFPPPMSMMPHEPYGTNEPYRTKSPFVGALATGPDRPYTPFGREIMSQLSMELPHDHKISFSNALHTAPDDSFDPSSLEYDYDPVEYTAKVYERIAVAEEEASISSAYVNVGSSTSETRSFLPKIQPWSTASEQIADNSYTDSMSGQESLECQVSESRRCSEFQSNQRRRSSVAQEGCCDSRRCSEAPKQLSDLLKSKVREEEEEFDPDKPNPNAMYPRRSQPSPFEGMQVKLTNKMTSSLHKPDEIPTFQRKWFNLPTQNPPKTPEPEELRENVPMAFYDWPTSANVSRHSSISGADKNAAVSQRHEPVRASFAETGMSAKPPIHAEATISNSFPTRRPSNDQFPCQSQKIEESEVGEENEEVDEFNSLSFPICKIKQVEGAFPTRGVRKNSLLDQPSIQKAQFEKQRDLRQELHHHQQKMLVKHKSRQQRELAMMQRVHHTSEVSIGEEIQQNKALSHYEQEMEYKRQLELERQQRQKEKELKEQQAREMEYQRQGEERRQQELALRQKMERDRQLQTQREMEYQKIRNEQEEVERRQQEERDAELRMEQEEAEREIRRQQEQEKKDAEKAEARRLWDIRRKAERERELERLETELRNKREDELRRLEKEVRERRLEKQREEKEEAERRVKDKLAQDEADRELRRLEEEAAKEQRERELKLQQELKIRQKQEADRKQREEMELFNIEEEKRRNETAVKYTVQTYQQQTVWPPNSKPPTPAPSQQSRPIPIIKTDSETELNATKFRFEPLDEDQKRFMAGIRPPSTCYSPPTEEKPFPSIPYYQQHLAFYEAEPEHAGVFNPKAVSPTPNRSRSPAFGPPPNPLRAFVNKARDPELDESGIYLCGERLLSPIWYDKQHKQIPPAVQRKIHPLGSSRPPSKPDLNALNEAVRKHKLEAGTKPPPPPPPMPANQQPVQRRNSGEDNSSEKGVATSSDLQIPKGIVASQIRRLSGDATSLSLFPIRSSITTNENVRESFPSHEKDIKLSTNNNDFYDKRQHTRQTTMTTNSYASASISSAHQLTNNNAQSFNQHFMGQSLASSSFQNSNMNQNSVDNVRVSIGSVGAPGGLPKHGRTFTTSGPNRGQGVLTQPGTGRIPICGACATQVRLVMGSSLKRLFA